MFLLLTMERPCFSLTFSLAGSILHGRPAQQVPCQQTYGKEEPIDSPGLSMDQYVSMFLLSELVREG
jgi:hypothetical protein